MVKINNQRERSSICWRWSEGTDNGRQKTNHGYDVIVGGNTFTVTPITPHQTSPSLKLKSTGAGRYQLLSRWWDAQTAWPERLLSEKSLWHCSRLRSVALYL